MKTEKTLYKLEGNKGICPSPPTPLHGKQAFPALTNARDACHPFPTRLSDSLALVLRKIDPTGQLARARSFYRTKHNPKDPPASEIYTYV